MEFKAEFTRLIKNCRKRVHQLRSMDENHPQKCGSCQRQSHQKKKLITSDCAQDRSNKHLTGKHNILPEIQNDVEVVPSKKRCLR